MPEVKRKFLNSAPLPRLSNGPRLLSHGGMFSAELRSIIREELERNRHADDARKIRFLISEGTQRLKGLKEMLEMQQGHA